MVAIAAPADYRGGFAQRHVGTTAEGVSTVIPSRARPHLVGRAVRSALDQTLRDLEVIVVVDGPDTETGQALDRIADARLRVIQLRAPVGAQEARNIGVREAKYPWIAFLDDDDEWLPEKLGEQIDAARASRWTHPVVSCGLIARSATGDRVWPRRPPGPSETVADYLFLRRYWETDDIRLQTSTLLTTRRLLTEVPWRRGAHDEWDLLLRASALEGVGLAFAPQPLAIWHSDAGTERLSLREHGWRRSADWLRSVQPMLGPRAYASFLLSSVSLWARSEGDWTAFISLPWQAARLGRPTLPGLLGHTARWILPRALLGSVKTAMLSIERERR